MRGKCDGLDKCKTCFVGEAVDSSIILAHSDVHQRSASGNASLYISLYEYMVSRDSRIYSTALLLKVS
jgi:hypothetical protein